MDRLPVDPSSGVDEDAINSKTSVEEIIRALAKCTRVDITSSIDLSTGSEYPCAGGSFCDVFQGKKYDGTNIAIKSLRVYHGPEAEGQRSKILKIYLWSRLRHRNVLPLIGLMLYRGRISMVSEWMDNGNIMLYILRHPNADRICLCMDICAGLDYIHENRMVHGDLKAANVVVSSNGVAMITDFGNAHLKDLTLRFSNTISNSISVRWTAPELLQGNVAKASKEADVYAYGITALEVLSGETPYKDLSDIQVLHWVAVEKKYPPRLDIDISNDLWDVLTSCWTQNPTERPAIARIGQRLQDIHPRCNSHPRQSAASRRLSNAFSVKNNVPIQVYIQSIPEDREESSGSPGVFKEHDQTDKPPQAGQVTSNAGDLERIAALELELSQLRDRLSRVNALENKVFQLTQTLQQRTGDRKAAENQARYLEGQLTTWQAKHEDAESRARKFQTEIQTLHVPSAKFEELLKSKTEVEARLEQALAKVAEQEAQITKLNAEVQATTSKPKEAASNTGDLGQRGSISGLGAPTGAGGVDGVSRFENEANGIHDDPAEERIRVLSDLDGLGREVYGGLITSIEIPPSRSTSAPSRKEVLFPANLISLIWNEMWKHGMIKESKRFLSNTMQTIQAHVMSFSGEDAIIPGVFWLSNVHEILSFVCCAENDLIQGIGPIGNAPNFDWEAYENLIQMIKSDLDRLEYNIYHSWMVETKKRLSKMIIPALIETRSLPGLIIPEGATPAFSMDVLNLLNKVLKSLKCFFMEESVIHQVVTELLKLIGVTSFNHLLMMRNSWERAMRIQANVARIEEWCISNEISEGTLQLEHLMQATKLIQLKKITQADIDAIYDVCWILTPSQIQRICASYETPISSEILKLIVKRVQPNDWTDRLLLTPENEDVTPYELPQPRMVSHLEHYIPTYLNIPNIRRLAAISP